MADLTNISSKYDLIEILQNIGNNYFGDELSESRVGMFGFVTESIANMYGALSFQTNMRSKEYLVATAMKRSTLQYDAFKLGITIPDAYPTNSQVYLGIKVDDIFTYGTLVSSDPKVYKLVIEKDSIITIDKYPFKCEFDIELTASYSKESKAYSYTAKYLTEGDIDYTYKLPNGDYYVYPKSNCAEDISGNYISCYRTGSSSKVIVMRVDLKQLEKISYDYVVTDTDTISLTGIDFAYSNQFSYFNIYYKNSSSNVWTYMKAVPKYDTASKLEDVIYYETMDDDSKLRLDFTGFEPEYNSTIRVEIYSTIGDEVNGLTYTGDGTDIKIQLQSPDNRHAYSGMSIACSPISTNNDGTDTLTMDEIRAYLAAQTSLLNAIISERDISTYLTLVDPYNSYYIAKSRSDIVNMTYSITGLLRDLDDGIISTRSNKIEAPVAGTVKSAGTSVIVDSGYVSPYDIMRDEDDIISVFASNIKKQIEMRCVDSYTDSTINFKIDHVNIERDIDSENKYVLVVSAMADGDFSKAINGDDVNTNTVDKTIILKGFIYSDPANNVVGAIFDFSFTSYSENVFTFTSNMKVSPIVVDGELKLMGDTLYDVLNVNPGTSTLNVDEEYIVDGEQCNTGDDRYVFDPFDFTFGIGCYYLNYDESLGDNNDFLYIADSRMRAHYAYRKCDEETVGALKVVDDTGTVTATNITLTLSSSSGSTNNTTEEPVLMTPVVAATFTSAPTVMLTSATPTTLGTTVALERRVVKVWTNTEQTTAILYFYYDEIDHSSEGTVTLFSSDDWKADATITDVIITSSWADSPALIPFKNMSALQNIIGMKNMPYGSSSDATENYKELFYGCSSLKKVDLSYLNNPDNVTDPEQSNTESMFYGCSALTNIYTSSSNDWSSWADHARAAYLKHDSIAQDTIDGTLYRKSNNMFYDCRSLSNFVSTTTNGYGCSTTAHTFTYYTRSGLFSRDQHDVAIKNYLQYVAAAVLKPVAVKSALTTAGQYKLTFYYDAENHSAQGTVYDITSEDQHPWPVNDTSIKIVDFDGSFHDYTELTSTANWFKGFSSLEEIRNTTYLYTNNVTDMSNMFEGCSSLSAISTATFNTTNVTKMASMFKGCSSIQTLSISTFNTANVTDMSSMFEGCIALNDLTLPKYLITSKTENLSSMFKNCQQLTTISAVGWNIVGVKYFTDMFSGCTSLEYIYSPERTGWYSTSSDSEGMFTGCSRLPGITSVVNATKAKITEEGGYFTLSESLHMSVHLYKIGELKVSLKTETDDGDEYIYYRIPKIKLTFYYDDISHSGSTWSAPEYDTGTACQCDIWANWSGTGDTPWKLTKRITGSISGEPIWIYIKEVTFDSSFVNARPTSLAGMFCGTISQYDTVYNQYAFDVLNLTNLNTSAVTDMNGAFRAITIPADTSFKDFDTSKVTNMTKMFRATTKSGALDIRNFDVSNVLYMNYMFGGNAIEHENLTVDFSGWRLKSGVTLDGMFAYNWGTKYSDATFDIRWSNYASSSTDMFKDSSSSADARHAHVGPNNDAYEAYFTLSTRSKRTAVLTQIEGTSYYQLTFYHDLTDRSASSIQVYTITDDNTCPWYSDTSNKSIVYKVSFDSSFSSAEILNMDNWFDGFTNLALIENISNLKTSSVTSMNSLFKNCTHLEAFNLAAINTSAVKSMASMFEGCTGLESFTLAGVALTNAVTLNGMFNGCNNLITIYANGLDVSKVDDMSYMFNGCTSLTTIYSYNATAWSPMTSICMFQNCSQLPNWDASNPVTNASKAYVNSGEGTGYFTLSSDVGNVAVLSGRTLRFYHDGRDHSSEGTVYTITSSTPCPWVTFGDDKSSAIANITAAYFDSSFKKANITSTAYWFYDCAELIDIYGMENINTSNVTDMREMFMLCQKLSSVDLSAFNTSKVTNMESMFYDCEALTSINCSTFDTRNVTDMSMMFWKNITLVSVDISHFVTDKVGYFTNMFALCTALKSVECGNWDILFVPDYLANKTGTAYAKTTINNPNYLEVISDTSPEGDHKIRIGNIQNVYPDKTRYPSRGDPYTYEPKVGDYVASCPDNGTGVVCKFGTTSMNYMFSNCSNLERIYVPSDTRWLPMTNGSFVDGCVKLVGGDGTAYDASYVDRTRAYEGTGGYFTKTTNLPVYVKSGTSVTFFSDGQNHSAAGVEVKQISNESYKPWTADTSVTSITFNSSFINANIYSVAHWFEGFTGLETVTGLANFNFANVSDMSYMFSGCTKLKTIDVSSLNTQSVQNMSYAFAGCTEQLTSLLVDNWNTGNVRNMSNVFFNCKVLTTCNVADWDTSKVTNMENMFGYCEALQGVDVSTWVIKNVTNMNGMFDHASALKHIFATNILPWTPTSSTNMFLNCISLPNYGTTYIYVKCEEGTTGALKIVADSETPSSTEIRKSDVYELGARPTDVDVDDYVVKTLVNRYEKTDSTTTGALKVIPNDMTPATGEILAKYVSPVYPVEYEPVPAYYAYTDCTGSATGALLIVAEHMTPTASQIKLSNVTPKYPSTYVPKTGAYFECQETDPDKLKLVATGASTGEINLLDMYPYITSTSVDMLPTYPGHKKTTSTATGALLVVESGATTGQINRADVVPFPSVSYSPAPGDYVMLCDGVYRRVVSDTDGAKLIIASGEPTSEEVLLSTVTTTGVWPTAYTPAAGDYVVVTTQSYVKYIGYYTHKEECPAYAKCKSTESGALHVVQSGATTGEINIDEVTPVHGSYTPTVGDYVYTCLGDYVKENTPVVDATKACTASGCYFTNSSDVIEGIITETDVTGKYKLTLYYGAIEHVGIERYVVSAENLCPWYNSIYNPNITTVEFDSSFASARPISTTVWFAGMSSLKTITGIERLKTNKVVYMGSMFQGCSALEHIDLSSFKTNAVTMLSNMFYGCTSVSTLNLSSFTAESNPDVDDMFYGCTSLTSIDLSQFNPTYIDDASGMFYNCGELITVTVPSDSDWRQIIGTSTYMFSGCNKILNSDSGLTDAQGAFPDKTVAAGGLGLGHFTGGASKTKYVDIANNTMTFYYKIAGEVPSGTRRFTFSNNKTWSAYESLASITTITFDSSFKKATVTDCTEWFKGFSALTTINNISNFNTTDVESMDGMFEDCTSLVTLDISSLNTESVTTMKSMFKGCTALTTLTHFLNTTNVVYMTSMFEDCTSLSAINVSTFNTLKTTNFNSMFKNTPATSIDLTNFDMATGNVYANNWFEGCANLTTITVKNNTDWRLKLIGGDIFKGCVNLPNFPTGTPTPSELGPAKAYINSGEGTGYFTGNVNLPKGYINGTTMTFYYDTETHEGNEYTITLAEPCPWKTESQVVKSAVETVVFNSSFASYQPVSTEYWFSQFRGLKTITNITNLQTQLVTSMKYMFSECESLESLDLGQFHTSNVTTFEYMFYGCSSLKNLTYDINIFSTKSETTMNSMFRGCSALNELNVSHFTINHKTEENSETTNEEFDSLGYMFTDCSSLIIIHSDNQQSWASLSGCNGTDMFTGCTSLAGSGDDANAAKVINQSSEEEEDEPTPILAMVSAPVLTSASNDDVLGRFTSSDTRTMKAVVYANNTTTLVFEYNTKGVDEYDDAATYDDGGTTKKAVWIFTNTRTWLAQNYFSITTIVYDSSFADARPTSCDNWFNGLTHLTACGWSTNFNTSAVTSMDYMFKGCTSLTNIQGYALAQLNLSSLVSMTHMFEGCTSLIDADLSYSLTTSTLNSVMDMFNGCTQLGYAEGTVDMSGLNTSSLQVCSNMFYGCSALESITIFPFVKSSELSITSLIMLSSMFYGCTALDSIDLSSWNVSTITTMDSMFEGCTYLSGITINTDTFRTNYVSTMSKMFKGCSNLTAVPTSKWNASRCTNFESMFENSGIIAIDVTNFMPPSGANFTNMFNGCSSLTKITSANTTSWGDDTVHMFTGCTSLSSTTKTYVEGEDTADFAVVGTGSITGYFDMNTTRTPKVVFTKNNTQYSMTFYYDTDPKEGKTVYDVVDSTTTDPLWLANTTVIGNTTTVTFDTTFKDYVPTSMYKWFAGFSSLQSINITNLTLTNITSIAGLFMDCTSLSSIDIEHWNTSSVKDMSYLLKGCTNMNEVYIGDLDISSLENVDAMFQSCTSLERIYGYYNTDWRNKSISGTDMFALCNGLLAPTAYVSTNVGINMAYTGGYFTNNSNPTPKAVKSGTALTFYYDNEPHTGDTTYAINSSGKPTWDGKCSDVTNIVFNSTFASIPDASKPVTTSYWFDQFTSLKSIEGWQYFDTSKVTDMSYMFSNCTKIESLDLTYFNTSNVTTMQHMFVGCAELKSITFGDNFNTSKVTTMSTMFAGCVKLEGLDVSKFKTTSELKNMDSMFKGCAALEAVRFGDGFKTTNVTTMAFMFSGCSKLKTVAISGFDVSRVETFESMFGEINTSEETLGGCVLLDNPYIENFVTSSATNMKNMFRGCKALTNLNVTNFDIKSTTVIDGMFYDCIKLTKIYSDNDSAHKWAAQSSTDMFKNCGTDNGYLPNWKPDVVNDTYAYIDNGTTGYFSEETEVTIGITVVRANFVGDPSTVNVGDYVLQVICTNMASISGSVNSYPKYCGLIEYESGRDNKDYILTDVYSNLGDKFNLYEDMTDIIRLDKEITTTNSSVMYLTHVPCITATDVAKYNDRIREIMFNAKTYLENIKERLLNNFETDFRFYNTSGSSAYFKLAYGDDSQSIDLAELSISLKLTVILNENYATLDSDVTDSIKVAIKNAIESGFVNNSNNKLYVSSALHDVAKEFETYIRTILCNSINNQDSSYCVIKYVEDDSGTYIPEFISVPVDKIDLSMKN